MEALYRQYNRREFLSPDPLEVLYDYDTPADREVAGLVAASLAFGRVRSILASVRAALGPMGPCPAAWLDRTAPGALRKRFAGFRHRYVGGRELADLLVGVRRVRREAGSLERAFALADRAGEATVLPALQGLVDRLRAAGAGRKNYLLPDPAAGSACKRLHLFLRWMVRQDEVDPGGWSGISPARLIVPLDVHMHRICRSLGFTRRRSANLSVAVEVTEAFRRIRPDDPVRYDFALTRLGIRPEADMAAFLARYLASAGQAEG